MASSRRPGPVNVGTVPAFNAQSFSEAIPSDRDRAVAMLRAQVPMDGPSTPRAAEYIINGEWDDELSLPILFVSSDACVGWVGSIVTGNTVRFCGLFSVECRSRTHSSTIWHSFQSGWFIPGGAHRGARCPVPSEVDQ
jgi:hypothetical protein